MLGRSATPVYQKRGCTSIIWPHVLLALYTPTRPRQQVRTSDRPRETFRKRPYEVLHTWTRDVSPVPDPPLADPPPEDPCSAAPTPTRAGARRRAESDSGLELV